MTANLTSIDVGDTALVRDLWNQEDLGSFEGDFWATVPAHGAVLVRVSSEGQQP